MPVPRLFCLDTVLVDVDLRVSSLPERAGDVRASSQLITTGGGFNAMSAATRHDLAVVYAGRLGRGPFAAVARKDLASEGIETPLESNDELDCGVCVVLVEPDGERTLHHCARGGIHVARRAISRRSTVVRRRCRVGVGLQRDVSRYGWRGPRLAGGTRV